MQNPWRLPWSLPRLHACNTSRCTASGVIISLLTVEANVAHRGGNFFPCASRLLENGKGGSGKACGGPGQVGGMTTRAEAAGEVARNITVRARVVNYLRAGRSSESG